MKKLKHRKKERDTSTTHTNTLIRKLLLWKWLNVKHIRISKLLIASKITTYQ